MKKIINPLVRASSVEFDLEEQIIKFFLDNPSANDPQVHTWANSLRIEPEVMEAAIYRLLSGILRSIGKHDHVPDVSFDPIQLDQGIRTEMEHTDVPFIAKMIAKDHLVECPDYYTYLAKAESDCSRDENKEEPVLISASFKIKRAKR